MRTKKVTLRIWTQVSLMCVQTELSVAHLINLDYTRIPSTDERAPQVCTSRPIPPSQCVTGTVSLGKLARTLR
jgi:hypothetical protein